MQDLSGAVESNFTVVAFFVLGAAIMAFLASRFASSSAPVFRNFGLGLACYSAAFAIWSAIVWAQPQDLHLWVTLGVAIFLPGYCFLLRAATQNWQARNRNLLQTAAIACLIGLFMLRTFVAPSEPGFSENGLFYFNAQPIVLMGYIVSFAGTALSAVYSVARSISLPWLSRVTLICFNLVVICGVILLTSYDDELQMYNGYLMGISLLVLCVIYIRYRPTKHK